MKKAKTFKELVKNQEEIYDTVVSALLIISVIFLAFAIFYVTVLNKLTIIMLFCLSGISLLIAFLIKSYVTKKSIQESLYSKVPVECITDSAIKYYVKDATDSDDEIKSTTLFIRSDYMQEYCLKITGIKNIEETLKTLSKLPKDLIAKTLLNRVESGVNTIADTLDIPVCVMQYEFDGDDNYFDENNWKILIKENAKHKEICRYIPKNEK